MERIVSALLVAVGLVNLLPLAGVASAEVLAKAYGIEAPTGDLLILMRHRALLFGILGAVIVVSAFRHHLQPTAIAVGLVSMLGFVGLAWAQGQYGAQLRQVVLIDAIASTALISVALARYRLRRRSR